MCLKLIQRHTLLFASKIDLLENWSGLLKFRGNDNLMLIMSGLKYVGLISVIFIRSPKRIEGSIWYDQNYSAMNQILLFFVILRDSTRSSFAYRDATRLRDLTSSRNFCEFKTTYLASGKYLCDNQCECASCKKFTNFGMDFLICNGSLCAFFLINFYCLYVFTNVFTLS